MTSLGYPSSDFLERTEEGIISHSDGTNHLIFGLLDYPVTVQFSGRAIQKIINDYQRNDDWSSIDIIANTKSGKKVTLFTVNIHFFSRVFIGNPSKLDPSSYKVGSFKYDPNLRSISGTFDCERTLFISEKFLGKPDLEPKQSLEKDDIALSFSANYLLGSTGISKIHEFAIKFFSADEFPEELRLHFEVNNDDTWDLEICQRRGKPSAKIADNFDWDKLKAVPVEEKEQKNPVIEAKPLEEKKEAKIDIYDDAFDDAPEDFKCTLTLGIMIDPVIAKNGITYERSAITAVLLQNGKLPESREAMKPEDLIPNRALKSRIEAYLKEKKQ